MSNQLADGSRAQSRLVLDCNLVASATARAAPERGDLCGGRMAYTADRRQLGR